MATPSISSRAETYLHGNNPDGEPMNTMMTAVTGGACALLLAGSALAGEQIAYSSCHIEYDEWGNDVQICDVYVTDPDGLTTTPLTDGVRPSWSPDGTRIAFVGTGRRGEWSSGEISVLDLGTGAIVNLTNSETIEDDPVWSSDGTRIAFTSSRSGTDELYVMNADGSDVRQITSSGELVGHPSWSADGQTIAFTCYANGYDICAVSAPGGPVRHFGVNGGGAAWSPLSPTLIFSAGSTGGGVHLATMNADGSNVTTVGSGIAGYLPAWSPDATRIAFELAPGACDAWGACNDHLFTANADGSNAQMIADGSGAAWTDTPLTRFIAPPVAMFYATCSTSTCTFDGRGSWDNDSTPSFSWDFGDGSTGSGDVVTHTYTSPASVTVTLTATDADGLTSTSQQTFVVGDEPPVALFTQHCSGRTCTFDGSASSDPDGTIASYAWSFGDGSTGSGPTATHTYAPGTYNVALFVTDNIGATAATVSGVEIANVAPAASFTFTCTYVSCSFDGSSSSDSDGVVTSWAWSFGDGAGASGPVVSHAFSASGTFTVALTVRDNDGVSVTTSRSVGVSRPLMHCGDLDAVAARTPPAWKATVTITVHDGEHAPLANVTVAGSWSTGPTSSCVTNAAGQCAISLASISIKTSAVTLTLQNVADAAHDYLPSANHDPDGDSNGTSISVKKP